jgi:hypothetical protein
MPNELLKASAGTLDVGIDEFSADFSPEINLDFESQNLTSGIYRGIGPRVGMATLPGHADNESLAANAGNNMRQAEGDYGADRTRSIYRRFNIYNIFPLKIGSYNDINTEQTVYAWLMSSQGRTASLGSFDATTNLSLYLNSTYSPYIADPVPQQMPYTNDFRDGFHVSQGNGMSTSVGSLYKNTKEFPWNAVNLLVPSRGQVPRTKSDPANSTLTISNNTFYVCAISVSYSGRNIPCKFLVGDTTGSTANGTTAPKINFWKFFTDTGQAYIAAYSSGCVSSSFQKGNFDKTSRNFKVYTFGAQTFPNYPNEFVAAYNVNCTNVEQAFNSVFNYLDAGGTNYHVDFTGNTTDLLYGPIGSYSSIKTAMLEDDQGFTNSSFRAVLAAPNKAIGWIIQDWLRTPEGMLPQIIDFANHSFQVPIGIANNVGTPYYTEDGIPVTSSFAAFPDYVSNTPLSPAYGVSLTSTTGTGIFRSNTTYELTYSYYNKRLDFETNVGKPVKFRTGATDFVGLQVTNTNLSSRVGQPRFTQTEGRGILFWEFFFAPGQQSPGLYCQEINSTEIRFYYRQFGSFEWLPLYFVDAAKWWFYPFFIDPAVAGTGIVFGESPVAGLPGGQPGGFIDNSRLPDLQYDCVLSFQDRIWWFAKDSINFSLRNNMFVYPVKNSIGARTGSFEGGIVHNYPGQAQQTSRLLIFGTKEVYVARFTGSMTTAPVQVSETTIGEYPVDASDLVIDTWTTNTAFSYRSAVVAEGIAYWWGPTGVYRDNGVDTPKKISLRLEPGINNLYDPSDVKNIHCSYDATAKEITWYYKPKAGGDITKGITWNLIDEEWLPQTYNAVIDNVFSLKIETDMDNSGPRTVMVSRASRSDVVNRAYFWDAKTHGCGDIFPKKDFVIKQISTPSTGQRRLYLAAGYDATNFATMSTGDFLALKNVTTYAPGLTNADDMLAQILAVNTLSGYIDIKLPRGAALDGAVVLNQKNYFPIYHKTPLGVGQNGFIWRLKSKYWLPFGINFFGNWLWLYIFHKLNLVASDSNESYSIGYRTPTSGPFVYDEVFYSNNSDGNWQLYHPFRTAETNNQGQAIKLDLTGVQIASDLVLQLLELHCTEETGNKLKDFEG